MIPDDGSAVEVVEVVLVVLVLLMPLYFTPDVSSCDQCSTFLMNHSFQICLAWPALATKTLELMSSWHIHIGSPCLVLQVYSFLWLRNAVDIGLGLQVDRTPIRSNHLKPKGWLWDGAWNQAQPTPRSSKTLGRWREQLDGSWSPELRGLCFEN